MAIRRWKLGTACWTTLLFVLSAQAGAEQLTVKDLTASAVSDTGAHAYDVNQAIVLFNRGDYAGAMSHLQEAKKLTPVLAPPEVMMAQLHFAAGQVQAGNAMLEKALQAAPGDPEPYVMLLERAAGENRLTEAGLLFPQAEKLALAFSDSPRRRTNLQSRTYMVGAAIDEALQKFGPAQAKLESLLKVDDRNAAAHQRLGRVLILQAGGEELQKRALAEFARAAELDPKALPAGLMMAMLAKDRDRAEKWIAYALQNSGNDVRSQSGAADYYLKTGQLDKAREYSAAALKLDPQGFETNLLNGLAANLSGNYAEAIERLQQAHLLQPTNSNVVGQLTLALLESPNEADKARAVEYAEMNARAHPESLDAQATLGWVYSRSKRLADADRVFKQVFGRGASGPVNLEADTRFILAYMMVTQGLRDDAARMLQPLLAAKPLFFYRTKAEQLLAQLSKTAPASSPSASPSSAAPTKTP